MPSADPSPRPIHIYQFLLDNRWGGPHVRIEGVSKHLPEHMRTHMVTCGRADFASDCLLNLRRRWRPLYLFELLLNPLVIFARFFWRRLTTRMIWHVNGPANLAPLLTATLLRVPVVYHFNDSYGSMGVLVRIGKLLCRLNRSRYVASAEDAAQAYGLANYTLLHPAVDTDFWSRDAYADWLSEQASGGGEQAASDPGDAAPSVLCVGNLNNVKGQDLLLEAFSILQSRGLSSLPSLSFIGARLDTQEAHYQRLANHAMFAHAEWLGKRDRDAIRDAQARATIYVLASRSEACPVALMEAMAMECACVATTVGGVREMVPGEEAWLAEPENPESLADALGAVLAATREERARRAALARASILRAFSTRAIAEITRELYEGL